MNRTDRLTGIILALQRGRQTAAQLAERFEVSRRTILRDVDALCQVGVPVVALPGAGGGLELEGDYWLRPIQLTQTEAAALLLAARGLGTHPSAPWAAAGLSGLDKLRGALRPEVLAAAERDLDVVEVAPPRHAKELSFFSLIRGAVVSRTWLRVEYQSLRRVATHTILPRSLVEQEGFWYVRAVSLEVGAERQYRIDRLVEAEAVETPDGSDEAVRLAGMPARPYHDPSHPEVVVALTYQGALLAKDLPRREKDVRQTGPDSWEMRFRCPESDLPYYSREMLRLGAAARVTSPPELRTLVHDLAQQVAAAHRDEDDEMVSPFTT